MHRNLDNLSVTGYIKAHLGSDPYYNGLIYIYSKHRSLELNLVEKLDCMLLHTEVIMYCSHGRRYAVIRAMLDTRFYIFRIVSEVLSRGIRQSFESYIRELRVVCER